MAAATVSLQVDVGLEFFLAMQLMEEANTPFDLTGCSLAAGIRPRSGVDPLIDLTVTVVDAVTGQIEITPAADAIIPLPLDSYAWDMRLTDTDGREHVIMRGPVEKFGVVSI